MHETSSKHSKLMAVNMDSQTIAASAAAPPDPFRVSLMHVKEFTSNKNNNNRVIFSQKAKTNTLKKCLTEGDEDYGSFTPENILMRIPLISKPEKHKVEHNPLMIMSDKNFYLRDKINSVKYDSSVKKNSFASTQTFYTKSKAKRTRNLSNY